MPLSTLRLRLLTVVTASTALGSLASGCNSTVVVQDGDDPDPGTGGTDPVTNGTGGAGGSTSTSTTTGGSTILTCAPDQPTPGMGDPWGYPDQCFSAADLAKLMSEPAPPDLGEACSGGVLCPSIDQLVEYEPGCSDFAGDPYSVDGNCCYAISCYCCGRPMTVDGQARQAAATNRTDWLAVSSHARPLADPALRDALADAWLADALLEHASIASFARFTLQLLGLGAPAELVEASQQASLDEVRHARDCFALASRYADTPLGPASLDLSGALAECTLEQAVAATILEGCIGETIASAMADAQHARAQDPQARATLARIADDEARHAELAWRFLRWALDVGGEPIAAIVRRTFAQRIAEAEASLPSAPFDHDVAVWHHHGRLTPAEQADVSRAALERIIAPCAAALLTSRAA